MKYLDLSAQYRSLKPCIDRRIQKVLDHGQYIMGPEVNEFEEALADYIGVSHVISCANGTDALQLALMSLGVVSSDVVVTTPFTFCATAEAIAALGARPVFSDVSPDTFNLCPDALEKSLNYYLRIYGSRLKAVIAVDLFGLPADYQSLHSICEKYGLYLIEDAAQSIGSSINGDMAGSFGSVATTSFFPAKPLGCYGDGGAVLTNDKQLAELTRSFRVHGQGKHKYENIRVGMNSRLDTIQAAILLEKLPVLNEEIAQRNSMANEIRMVLEPLGIDSQVIPSEYSSAWAQYTLQINKRDEFKKKLAASSIPTNIYYPLPLHKQPAYSSYHDANVDLTTSELLANKVLSVPINYELPGALKEIGI